MRILSGDELEQAALRYRQEGKWAEAFWLYVQAAELVEAADAHVGARLWNSAGFCGLKIFDPDRATLCFRRALDQLPEDVPDRQTKQVRLYANLAAAYYEGSRIREAWEAGQQALLLAGEVSDPRVIAQAVYNLGLTCRYLGRLGDALDCFRQARARHLEIQEKSAAADALHNLGWVHLDRLELDQGELTLQQARGEKQELGELTTRVDVELARLALLRGNWIDALAKATYVLDTVGSLTDPVTKLHSLLVAAEAARPSSLQNALGYVEEAVRLAQSLGRPPVLLDLLPLLARLRVEAGLSLSEAESSLSQELYRRRMGLEAFRALKTATGRTEEET